MSHGPIYLWQLIYQAKTGPVEFTAPFAETVSVDRWLQPLSSPVPPKPGLHASQQQFQPYNETQQFPETVSEDRWHQPFSEPVRIKPALPAAEQQTLAFAPNPIIKIDWFNELSKPSELRRAGLGTAAQQFLAFDPAVYVATPDGWWRQFLDPPKVKQPVPWQQYLAFDPAVFVAPIDGWGTPLSDPPKPKAGLAAASQQFFATSLFFTAAAPPIDSWGAQLSIPQRQLLGLPAGEQQFLAYAEAAPFPESVSEDRWHQPWSEPVRTKQLSAALQSTTTFTAVVTTATVSVDGWGSPFADPVQFRIPWKTGDTSVSFAAIQAAAAPTVDGWGAQLSIPQRQLLGLPASAQQFLALAPTDLTPPISGWGSPLSEPPKPKTSVAAANQQFLAQDPAVFVPAVDAWWRPFVEVPKVKPTVAWQQYLAFSPTDLTPSVGGWGTPLTEPVRVKPSLATASQQALAFTAFFTATTPPVDGWGSQLSIPQRQLLGLPAGQQQFLALTESAPFPETVTEDRWHQRWTDPIQLSMAWKTGDTSVGFAAVQSNVPSVDGWAAPFSDPVRIKPNFAAGCQQFLALAPTTFTPTVDGWFGAFSDPVRPKARVTADANFFSPNFTAATVPPLDYYTWLSEPQRQLAGLAARYQQNAANGFVPIVPPFVFFFGNEEPLPWPGFRVNQFIRENYDQLAFPPFPIPNPPVTQAKFTVSGPSVHDLFPVSGVVYPYAPETRKTVP